jgi:gamma-glutamyltranspeptidase/glutathione hydrolase
LLKQRTLGSWCAFVALGLGLVTQAPAVETPAPAPSGFGERAVATENKEASREAMNVLRAGGTAADAAVVAALVGGVAQPSSSGIGGGGFLLAWDAATKKPFVIDFRETAPQGIDAAAFEKRPFAREERGRSVGVPGELRGLFELHRRAGKLRWADLVGRAERVARQGYLVGPHLNAMLGWMTDRISDLPEFSALYYPGGKPALVGTRIVNTPLANTLARIAAEGPDAFYRGDIASELAQVTRDQNGALTLEDLAAYKPIERTPLRTRFNGYDVYTMPVPSAGGLMLSQLLRMYSSDELKRLGFGTPAYQHLLAEGMRGAIADRLRYLGDPALTPVDQFGLLDEARLAVRRRSIALDRTHWLPRFGLEEHGTHHIVTADRTGNVVSLTTTVNTAFGAKLMAPVSGVVLNDELDDFTPVASVVPFGMKESPNRPRAGARPVSSMTPTIVVEAGRPVLALGGSGGTTIATNVTQVLLASLVFDQSPADAVQKPRIEVPTQNATLLVDESTPAAHIADLEGRGEIVGKIRFKTSGVQVVRFDGPRVEAAADPRKHGSALVE